MGILPVWAVTFAVDSSFLFHDVRRGTIEEGFVFEFPAPTHKVLLNLGQFLAQTTAFAIQVQHTLQRDRKLHPPADASRSDAIELHGLDQTHFRSPHERAQQIGLRLDEGALIVGRGTDPQFNALRGIDS